MNGLAVSVLVTTSISILGRVYNPGVRKTRVFSFIAAGSLLGFWVGCRGGSIRTSPLGLWEHINLFRDLCSCCLSQRPSSATGQ